KMVRGQGPRWRGPLSRVDPDLAVSTAVERSRRSEPSPPACKVRTPEAKETAAWLGSDPTPRWRVPAKLPTLLTVTSTVVPRPAGMVTDAGLRVNAKLDARIVSLTAAEVAPRKTPEGGR